MAKKILIIEDEVVLLKNLESTLKQNYEVAGVTSGKDGLKLAKREKPDLILLDLILPDIFGTKVLKKLKSDKATKEIPIIILTNIGDTQTISKAIELGCQEYLVKSDFGLDKVKEKVEEVLK